MVQDNPHSSPQHVSHTLGQSHYMARELDHCVRDKSDSEKLQLLREMIDFSQHLPNTIKEALHEKLRMMQNTHERG
jgi:hypothetical protein